jgi:transcriptional regulator with PAS, ATPase and Fis domain
MMTEPKTPAGRMFVLPQHPEALTELDKLASAYFKASDVGLCVIDSGLHYIAINKALAEMNGVPAQDHLGKTVRDVLGEIGSPIEKKISEVMHTHQPLRFDVSGKLPSRTDSAHWIAHYVPIMSGEGFVSRVGAIVLEVTASGVLEESLQKLTRQLRQETSRLQMLTDVAGLLSSNWDVVQVFPRVSARIRRVLCRSLPRLRCMMPGLDCSFIRPRTSL